MWDFGKSTLKTGRRALVANPRAISQPTLAAPRRFGPGVATLSSCGPRVVFAMHVSSSPTCVDYTKKYTRVRPCCRIIRPTGLRFGVKTMRTDIVLQEFSQNRHKTEVSQTSNKTEAVTRTACFHTLSELFEPANRRSHQRYQTQREMQAHILTELS